MLNFYSALLADLKLIL